ncbi:MAG: hypothetical protein ACRCXZ_04745, partial [Patescibacteria group bacterium]
INSMARKSSPNKIIKHIELYQVFLLTLGYLFTALYSLSHGHKKSEQFLIDNDNYKLEIKLNMK